MISRTASRLRGDTNALYLLREELTGQGRPLIDLVSGNVTEHGIRYPQALLEEIVARASRRCQVYRPDPLGQTPAREAVSEYYRACGMHVPVRNILLTPGTSISYWYCFKLLANEGEEILCPRPTYPLFDYIAELCGVRLIYYPLREEQDWAIDFEALENQISNATRAVILISPHNPTGHVATPEEIEQLAEIAHRHRLAVIADEVFSEFLITRACLPRIALAGAPLVFTLNGFSKMLALPGLKFGWAAISGEPDHVRQAMRALEFISDTFLPVNEMVQAAAPEIMSRGGDFLSRYAAEIRLRWTVMQEALETAGLSRFVCPDGGFYVTLRLLEAEEDAASQAALRDHHILVHPGYFYDMAPHHLVLSFAQAPDLTRQCLPKLAAAWSVKGTRP